MKKKNGFLDRIAYVIPVSLFFAFTLVFYGPLSLYLPNSQEMWFDLATVMKIVVPVSVGFFLGVSIIDVLLPTKIRVFFTKLLFGVSLALYVQGNYIKTDFGVLDGTDIDWGSAKAMVFNGLLWVFCVFLPFVIGTVIKKIKKSKKQKKTIKISTMKVLATLSLFLVAVQIPAYLSQAVSYQPNAQGNLAVTSDGIFDVARQDNTFIFVVDTLDESYFNEFIDSNPDFKKDMDGFVQYDNTTAAGIRTILAIPSLLTGKPYLRENLYSEYLTDIWSKENVLSMMNADGADVRVFSETTYFSKDTAEYVANFTMDARVGSYKILAERLYRLTMLKFAPQFAKKYFVINTADFNEAKDSDYLYSVKDDAFYAGFRENGFRVNDQYNKTFRLYHLHGAHSPYYLGKDGTYVEESTLQDQVCGNMFAIKEMVMSLKKMGLYDSSNIIILADHGNDDKSQWAALLIKEANATGDYKVSKAPVSLFDVPVYLASLANDTLSENVYGVDLNTLTEDTQRERHFFYNTSGSSRLVVNEYKTTAYAGEFGAVEKVAEHEDPNGIDTPYYIGDELSFCVEATGNRYCVEGFGNNTGFCTKIFGPCAMLQIPIADLPESGSLTVTVNPLKDYCLQRNVKILANNEVVFEKEITDDDIANGIKFDVPISLFSASDNGKLSLSICFPDLDESEMDLPVKRRTMSFAITGMMIKEKE